MSSVDNYDHRRRELENNVAASKGLLADLQREFATNQDENQRHRLEVNIEDVNRQLKDWEYELSLLTRGKE